MLEVVLYAIEMVEGMRRVLLCLPEVPEVMRCVTRYGVSCGGWALFTGGVGSAGGDALRAILQLEASEVSMFLFSGVR